MASDTRTEPARLDREIPIESLAGHFRERLGAGAEIVAATIASEGMSDDTWMVDVEVDGTRHELVVRRYRTGGALREETDPERHFRILAAVPPEIAVPEVLWYEADGEVAGGPFFVMRRVPGRVVVPWSPEGRRYLAEAGAGPLGEEFIEILARIHAIEWRGGQLAFLADEEAGSPDDDGTRRVAAMRDVVERYQVEPEPVLVDALNWLEHNKPAQQRTTVIHGDYRSGNVIFGEDRINAVLDWEFARIGDPASDLAWLLGRTNRMGSDLACYMMERERVLELYERHAGWVPSEESLRFWEIQKLLFNTGLWMSGEANYLRGETDDLTLVRWSYTLPNMRRMVLDALEEAS
ncbi:MAG TPA: phosphotransferase family protein [Solirubrobacterales bacterium]|nr:phosphotransferase family protein [Solirubrobacterales bacterium]